MSGRHSVSGLLASWRRPAMAAALVAIAATAIWLSAAGISRAGSEGAIVLEPSDATVGEGGTTAVEVVVTPPGEELSIWIIEVEYDPDVVIVPVNGAVVDCTSIEVPGGVTGIASCDTKDTSGDGEDDTFVAFGGWVVNEGGDPPGAGGLETVETLATVRFQGVGNIDDCSDLTINVVSFLDPDFGEHLPDTTNAEICVVESQGSERVWGNVDCSDDGVTTRDNQALLRFVLNQNPLGQTEPCPDVNTMVQVQGFGNIAWGNLDCSEDGVTTRDNQAELRFVLDQAPLGQTEPCPDIGDDVIVVE